MELDLRWKRVGRNGDESNTGKRQKVGKARTSAEPVRLSANMNLHVPSSIPGMIRERDRRVNSRENEKDDGKLALARRVVAKETN